MALQISTSGRIPAAELALIAEQLWPGISGSDVRVTASASRDPQWVVIERHSIAVWRGRVGMLLPKRRLTAARALLQYGRLRPKSRWFLRVIWALIICIGPSGLRGTIALEARRGSSANEVTTVMRDVADRRGAQPVSALMSVRRTANRKALLQVVDGKGGTIGFVKASWNANSADGVRAEIEALCLLRGGSGMVRVPKVLHEASVNGFPYVFIEALPGNIGRSPTGPGGMPSPDERSSFAPVVRWAPPGETAHVKNLMARVIRLSALVEADVVNRARQMLESIAREARSMPVVALWHGDLSFWNTGRTPDGTFWCWDFENSEGDALEGLDILHWHASELRKGDGAKAFTDPERLRKAAEADLQTAGLGKWEQDVIHRVYLTEIIVRALEVATCDGWEAVWATPAEIASIAENAVS